MRNCKVLIADDSALMRRMVGDVLMHEGFEVITAKNGREAVEISAKERPRVAILDVRMPVMDGISALKEIAPMGIPVIMFSSITQEDSTVTIDALELGAFDFLPKPGGAVTLSIEEVKSDLVGKVRAALLSKPPFYFHAPVRTQTFFIERFTANAVILVAASTGGPSMVKSLMQGLPADLGAAVLIVQHMPPIFTKVFADRLSCISKIPVKEAQDGEKVEANTAYVAPGDFHMEVSNMPIPKIILHKGPKVNYVRPAADPLFISASRRFGKRALALVLTGMGSDGAKGALVVKSSGGRVLVQDEATCTVFGMPKAVIDSGAADEVLPIDAMPQRIVELAKEMFKG